MSYHNMNNSSPFFYSKKENRIKKSNFKNQKDKFHQHVRGVLAKKDMEAVNALVSRCVQMDQIKKSKNGCKKKINPV